ncbi:hypothetical protein [Nocardioides lijunqiniae]|uniref:hypothetical protein n=1 Tax=Nocardioides lijunqiniae TaxID=2760832 RepID=UPI0018778C9B|nr:hypothetical protein [Nocardioides lijunqiniae]
MSNADDRIDQLLTTVQASLDATGVYVAPAMARYVDAADVARIEAAVARSPEPIFVVAYPLDYGDAFNGDAGDLLSRLHDRSDAPGIYVANGAVYAEAQEFRLEARTWGDSLGGTSADSYELSTLGEETAPGDLGEQLATVAEAVADGTVTEQYLELVQERRESPRTGADPGGFGDDGAPVAAYTVGGVVLAVVLVWAVAAGRRRSGRSRTVGGAGRREFTLPASVLDRVRDAHDEQLTRRAHREVLALGERIDAADMDAARAPRSWQAALDHYDAARRVLGEGDGAEVDVLDVVGAIVLAERGDEALTAALAGRPFEPTTPCFLDPLHGEATAEGSIERGGDRIAVPLCRDCRTELRKKRRPDILDVVRDGKPVHYFETDDEPWASTGYGALSHDLVERLHRRR